MRAAHVGARTVLGLVGLLLVLSATACGGGGSAESTGKPGEIAFDLEARDGARVAGVRAVLEFKDKGHTRIAVDGLDGGEPTGNDTKARVINGTCDEPHGLAYELSSLSGATSETTIDAGIPELLGRDLAIQVFTSADELDVIACGEIPHDAPDAS